MIKVIYICLLLAASLEDFRYHRIRRIHIYLTTLLGCICMSTVQEHRWVSLTLTCSFFLVLYMIYRLSAALAGKKGRSGGLGGADVRMIPGMMLVQGWDVALTGILIGLVSAIVVYGFKGRWREEIPLIPWMSAGCLLMMVIRM
ncbi:MAG: prepilin peptidase [Lachnospiraceae bacterium]|nr:prepilin peptidase [Lachnospiraceae bacterium]